MKQYNFLNKAFMLLILSVLFLQTWTNAQGSKKDQKSVDIGNMIQSKKFAFIAQYAFPLGGRSINLTSQYDLRLSSDTIMSDLPFYGRAFVAPMNPSEGGIHFTSTKFDYKIDHQKKGGWNITILPKDTKDVRQMFLSVTESGSASLQVTSNNRQSINFSGYIAANNKRK